MSQESDRIVVLFGGGGYIGPVIARHLLSQGYRVRIVDLFLYGTQNTMLSLMDHPRFEVMNGDQGSPSMIDHALKNATDVVILGGLVGDPITAKYPDYSTQINEDGIDKLINAMNGRDLRRVIFVSTCSNYGLVPEGVLADENYELSPLSLYAKAKVANELKILSKKGQVDYQGVVLRFATAFGLAPRMRFDLTVNQFTREMFMESDLLVYDPDTWRPYCHVRDFADIIERVLIAPDEAISFEVFNAGDDINNHTKRMIVERIQAHLPNAPVAYKEHGTDPRNYRVDFAKIRERLSFNSKNNVEDGIVETLAALRQNLFADVDAHADFYGNYNLSYSKPTS